MKKILQQGHFDGFCLLYAVANAFKTLKYPTKTANRFVSFNGVDGRSVRLISSEPRKSTSLSVRTIHQ